ncbi:DUF3459 domain-containing protein [Streptomyces sp. NPDC093094]|uniref:DUF3459 domain-containing protein n=1 Tax=Streptomyces sp. NPDC093094 TaxID=3366026 RepID=UPI00380333B6
MTYRLGFGFFAGTPASVLTLYRTALALRAAEPALGDGPMRWHPTEDGVLAFSRSDDFLCVVNLTTTPAPLPAHTDVLLSSLPLVDGQLPPDTAAWLRT